MLEVGRPDAVVHPGAVVVHPADAPVADAAVVREEGLEGLALRAHAQGVVAAHGLPDLFRGDGRLRDGPGVC